MTGTLQIRSKLALVLCTMMSGPALAASAQATQGVVNEPCPSGAIAVTPGRSIQTAVNQAGPNAAFTGSRSSGRWMVRASTAKAARS